MLSDYGRAECYTKSCPSFHVSDDKCKGHAEALSRCCFVRDIKNFSSAALTSSLRLSWLGKRLHKRIRPIRKSSRGIRLKTAPWSQSGQRSLLLTLQFVLTRPRQFTTNNQVMNHSARIANNQPAPTRCEISKTKTRYAQEDPTPRPSFASRMIRLVFKRGQRGTEQRAKSWPGRVEPVPVPVPVSTSLKHQPSATIAIPNSIAPSDPSTTSTECSRLHRLRKHSADDSYNEAHWRQRQTHCANCERLFFKSMSTLSSSAGRFCSLNCKANFVYLHQLQSVLNFQGLEFNGGSTSCGVSLDSSWADGD